MKAEQFLIEQWNKCILMVHDDYPENIVMVYDKQHERKLKLNSLNNTNENITFNKTNESIVLFYQDYKNGFFDVSYNEIWSVLEKKYRLNYQEIKDLIKTILLEDNKLKQLTTGKELFMLGNLLLEDNKLKQLTTCINLYNIQTLLLEDNKLKQLTTVLHINKK